MFPSPNKLAKYLLKSTLGKLFKDDFDWDQVDVGLINGTATLLDIELNQQVRTIVDMIL